MKAKKWVLLFLSVAIIFLAACGNGSVEKMTVTCENLSISIPSNYKDRLNQGNSNGYNFAYGYRDLAIIGIRSTYEELDGWVPTEKEYAQDLIYVNDLTGSAVEERDGLTTVYYETKNDKIARSCLIAFYAYNGGIWSVEFSCPKDTYSQMEQEILSILGSVNIQ